MVAPTRRVRFARVRPITRGAGGCGKTSVMAPDGRPAPVSSSSARTRSSARTGAPMSPPRSKRIDASVLRPSFLLVRRTDAGSKYALSIATRVVVADTSDARPPITPATATAWSRSAITSIDASSVRASPSRVVSRSPAFAMRTMSDPPASFAASNACIGWPISSIT